MKNPNDGAQLPEPVLRKLKEVRSRERSVHLWAGFLRGLALLLSAMLVAMAIDWLVGLHEERWRWALTLLALALGAAALAFGCLPPLLRPRSLGSIAREVDLAHPSLEERYRTLTRPAQSQDAPEAGGSEAIIQKVAQQAAALSDAVVADLVVSSGGLIRARNYLCAAAAVLLLLFAVNFSLTRILCERFWAPGADLSLTRLQAKTGDPMVGRGEKVILEITSTGKRTASATLFLRGATHSEAIPLQRSSSTNDGFAYTVNSATASFDYRARSGDGQTAWHRVTVLDRPKLSAVKLRLTPPAYSRLPTVEEHSLPRQIRALEGSQMEVSLQTDQPLASMELKFAGGGTQPLTESSDHAYHFQVTLTNSLSFTPVFTNAHRLGSLAQPPCEVVTYPDQPPTVTVVSPTNEITARHDDKIKIDFEARDDFGLASAELVVTVKRETNSSSVVTPIPLQEEAGARLVRKQVELDLAQFNLQQGQELSYSVRVTDTKQNPAQSNPGGSEPPKLPASGLTAETNSPANTLASTAATNSPTSNPADSTNRNVQAHLAMNNDAAAKPAQESRGSQPPPNTMSTRVLDAGQCSACQPMKILVDDWGHSFEGQMREKLEIAIDPVLKLLDQLLGQAQQVTDDTLHTGKSPAGLSQSQAAPLETSRGHLRQADAAVSDLKRVSQDTPYAFIGLQVHDVRETHISPARKHLSDVALEPAALMADLTNLVQASFHLQRAREKLAELTRSYESVKRDNKLSDALQRLTKMHQIFLEDTQALLGSKKPTLNPQDRKVAEVSDDFADQLAKLLEEKKKIMAELAKILADDPRLLRRFLALEQLEGTTLRDQMTLLAQRQQALAAQVTQWTSAGDKDRQATLTQLIASQSAEQSEVAALAAKLHENMVTWLPLEVSPDQEAVAACRNLAVEAARLATQATSQVSPESRTAGLESARQSLAELRRLQDRLPDMDSLAESAGKLSLFEANRLNETATLITRQSGWIKKIEALQAGDFPQAAEVDQHRLMLDTQTLSEKLDATAASVASLSAVIESKADELNSTVHVQILGEQSGATEALGRKTVKEAVAHQAEATHSFAKAETQFDDLLHLIIAKLDAAPAPTEVGQNKSLEELLAQLQDEQQAAEKLGIPCRPINVSIQKDWLRASSSSNPGQGRGQARAAQAQAQIASQRARQSSETARRLAQLARFRNARPPAAGLKERPKAPGQLMEHYRLTTR